MTVEVCQLGPDAWENRFFTAAPPDAAFAYIADFQRHVEWERELMTVSPINRRLGTAGMAYLKTYGTPPRGLFGRIFARGHRVTCKLRQVEYPSRIAWHQYLSHNRSGSTSFQNLELVITPSGSGSLIVLTRRFSGLDGVSADVVARYSARWGQVFQRLPPQVLAQFGRSGDRPGLFAAPNEVVRHVLDGYPSRGPGPSSLERLKAILDGGSRQLI